MGGGRRRLRRRAAGEAGRAPSPSASLALERRALDLSLPTGPGGATDCAPVPGPQKHGLGILTAETILISDSESSPSRMQRLGREREVKNWIRELSF